VEATEGVKFWWWFRLWRDIEIDENREMVRWGERIVRCDGRIEGRVRGRDHKIKSVAKVVSGKGDMLSEIERG